MLECPTWFEIPQKRRERNITLRKKKPFSFHCQAKFLEYAQCLHEHELDAISAKAFQETFKDFCRNN